MFYTNFEMDWDYILISGYKNGEKFDIKEKIKPYVFVDSAINSEYKTYKGNNVSKINFDSVNEARKFIKEYQGNPNVKIHGLPMFHYVHMYEHFQNENIDTKLIRILNYDIETDNSTGYPNANLADKQINVVTMKLFGSKECYTIALDNWDGGFKEPEIQKLRDQGYKFNFKSFPTEKELLLYFIKIWKKLRPDVITGWNINGFDTQYVIKRITQILGERYALKLSPFGKIKSSKTFIFNKEMDLYNIFGVPALDYMEIYKKFTQGREESYSLNYLSEKILNSSKLDYSDYGTLIDLQIKNFSKYISYNIIDVIRVEQIDEHIKYMSIAFDIAYESKTNFTDCYGTIRVWDIMIHNYLMDRKIVVPYFTNNRKERSIEGAYVKSPLIGKHKWVMSFDFKSLYPHLCMSFNISPETFVGVMSNIKDNPVEDILQGKLNEFHDKLVDKNVCVAGNGAIYKKDHQGFIPVIMENLFAKRAKYSADEDYYTKIYAETHNKDAEEKANIFATKSWAIKILLNGGYGALTNEFNRFFSDVLAESFTLSGKVSTISVLNYVNNKINEVLNTKDQDYMVACDTDSIYVKMDNIVELLKPDDQDPVDFLENYSDIIQGWIKEALEQLYYQTNIFQKKLFMSLESIGSAIWTAKKKYMMSLPSYKRVRYNPPKIKIMGIEAIRSSTPKVMRDWIKDSIPIALNEDDSKLKNYVDKKWNDYLQLDFNEISMPKGTNDIEKYYDRNTLYKKGTPIHIRGSLLYNNYIEQNNLSDHLQKIRSGDKIKVMYLKMPNPLMENVICTPEELPKELELFKQYIDYEKQFNVSFLKPIQRITHAADINISDQINIEQFFG